MAAGLSACALCECVGDPRPPQRARVRANFRSFHTQRISVALHLAAAEEILDTIMIDRAAHVQMGGN